jgi:hypothetical protein
MSRQSQRPHTEPIRPVRSSVAALDCFWRLNECLENALACRNKFATLQTKGFPRLGLAGDSPMEKVFSME